jgi:tetratricopeptide (TPR) repeat protein
MAQTARSAVIAFCTAAAMALAPVPAASVDTDTPAPAPAPAPSGGSDSKDGKDKKSGDKKSQSDFIDRYRAARALALDGRHEAAIAAFLALDHDDHPDVANSIGFSSRKVGRYEDARTWYERALAADPRHVRTWQYYGMWHVEQGNRLKAEEHLDRIRAICGTECQEFRDLQGALDGTVTY